MTGVGADTVDLESVHDNQDTSAPPQDSVIDSNATDASPNLRDPMSSRHVALGSPVVEVSRGTDQYTTMLEGLQFLSNELLGDEGVDDIGPVVDDRLTMQ